MTVKSGTRCANCQADLPDSGALCTDCGSRYTTTEYDLAYAILANGDIITSDGEPRDVDDFQLQFICDLPENKGREVQFRFRKPTPEEADAMSVGDGPSAN